MPEAHLDGGSKGCDRDLVGTKEASWLLGPTPVTGVTDGWVRVVSKGLLPEAHLDVPKASTLHWNL